MFIIREVNSDMPIYINRTNAGENQMPERDSNPGHPGLMEGALTTELPSRATTFERVETVPHISSRTLGQGNTLSGH